MSDYSLPRIKESALPEATNVDKVRVLDSTGKSVWVDKEDLPITETQVTGLTDDLALKADKSVEIIAGAGLTGGGDLSAARTFNVVSADDGITVSANDIKLNIVNDLTTSSATRALSATQGKKLQDEKEALANKSTDIVADAESTTKYPSVKLIKDYADSLVVGLLDYRGGFDASVNAYPSSGGSGTGGAILKGDMWVISIGGTIDEKVIHAGDSLIANVDSPGQTTAKWNTVQSNLSYVPEDVANKSTNVTSDAASDTKYPSVKAVKTYADSKVSLTGNETIEDVKTFSSSPIVPTPTGDTDAVNKAYVTSALTDALPVAQAELHPELAFYTRWLADTGTQLDEELLLKVYADYLNNLPETEFLFCPQIASKNRTDGVNQYINTLYDLGEEENDAVQTTEATQPYLGGYIAPNENRCLKFVSGQTQTGLLDFTDVVFAATDSWTLNLTVKANNLGRIYLGSAYIAIGASSIILHNGTDDVLTGTISPEVGKAYIFEFQYANGAGLIKANNIPLVTVAASKAVTFGQVSYNSSFPFDGAVYFAHLTNTRKSESDSQKEYTILRSVFPEIESIAIGNQVWATSNFEGVVAGDGTVIPEVQDTEDWAAATTIYDAVYAATSGTAAVKDLAATKAAAMWCYYDNSAANGAVYGRLYNWYAVHLFDLLPPVKGWRMPLGLDFTQLATYNGGGTVAGGKLKANFGGFNNAFANNESGFSIAAGGRGVSSFQGLSSEAYMWTIGSYYKFENTTRAVYVWGSTSTVMCSLRLLRNSPAGENELSYTSGLFTTDITSAAKQIPISFGRMVDAIRIKSENALTAVEAKLHNSAGTAVATLITGKSVSAGATMVFPVSADYAALLQDGTVRVTASGNSGAAVGMEIQVLTHKSVL